MGRMKLFFIALNPKLKAIVSKLALFSKIIKIYLYFPNRYCMIIRQLSELTGEKKD